MLVARIRPQGFLVLDYESRYGAARERLAGWVRDGALTPRIGIVEGLENTPAALLRLLHGENIGRQLVKL